jgi:hypothetical protein
VAVIEAPAPRSSASVIDDIIRLSEKNLKSQVVHSEVRRPGGSWPKLLGTWGLAALLLGLGLWQYNRHNSQALYEEWVEPITGKVLPAPPTAKTEEVAAVVPEVIAAAPAALKTEAISAPVAAAVAPSAVAASTQSVVVAPPAQETSAKEKPAAANNPATASTASAADCASITTEPVTATSVSPNKPGSYVYLVASKATTVCVDDGKNKRTLVTLTPGAGRSVHGAAPWTLASTDLKAVQVYFQGAKVWVPPEAGTRIYLKEQPISP